MQQSQYQVGALTVSVNVGQQNTNTTGASLKETTTGGKSTPSLTHMPLTILGQPKVPTPNKSLAKQLGTLAPLSTQRNRIAKWEAEELLGDQATIAMILYANRNYPNLKSEYPIWTYRIKQIAKIWKSLPNDKRQPFVDLARENRAASRINKQTMECHK